MILIEIYLTSVRTSNCLSLFPETLTELFLSDLLPPNRRLRWFAQQPVALLTELSSGNAVTRRKLLCAWLFEDRLKTLYNQFLTALDGVSKDTVDAHREKAVTALYKLLAGNPEQETVRFCTAVAYIGACRLSNDVMRILCRNFHDKCG